ncbi:MAG: DUF1559 domain-containing protein [Verrucomicrobiae bacterium]|nr:DUF1559 domain-containing protein [Verrucomicrobiae bacterium]
MSKARELARSIQCINNLRQLGAAAIGYVYEHEGWFPLANANRPGGEPELGMPWYADYAVASYVGLIRLDKKGPGQCPSDQAVWEKIFPMRKGLSYGMNECLGSAYYVASNEGYRRYETLKNPAATCLFMDANRYSLIASSPSDAWTFRHQCGANVSYADGHCGRIEKKQVPMEMTDVFWDKLSP